MRGGMSEKEFLEYVVAICERPKMYTPTGSFYEVVSFLEGFGGAANVGNHYHHSFSTPFRKWLAKKFDFPNSAKDFPIDWEHFQTLFTSEAEALNNLPLLYKDYIESLPLENKVAER